MMSISICICTYNRCEDLNKTLESLTAIKTELNDGDEILLIDNNSTDQTRSVANHYLEELPLHYYFEPTQGLSAARNKALAEIQNDTLIFIDDDVSVLPGFVREYRNAMETYSNCSFFGGKIHIDWQGKRPWWYKSADLPMLNGLLVHYDQGKSNHEYDLNSLLPYGANFVLRRELTDKVGLFNQNLGVRGNQIGRGEETEYFRRAIELGFKGAYIAKAKVLHRFQNDRISLKYIYRYGIQKGIAAVFFDAAQPSQLGRKIAYQFVSGLYQLLKLRVDRFYQCVINIGVQIGIYNASKLAKKVDN